MGVYIHIPFCRSKCFYCGFYSVASQQLRKPYVQALCREMDLRKDYLTREEAGTLYFGGGTPSCLPLDDLALLVRKLEEIYTWEAGAERTLEVNPEDAEEEKLRGWQELGFNRLSIGVQSFNDGVLKQIHRRHTAEEAVKAVEKAWKCGFGNIGVDLIIGLPGYDREKLQHDLEMVSRLPVTHVSVYMLSIDSGSVFEHMLRKGQFRPEDEEVSAERYLWVCGFLKNIGFEHYEISNFAKNSKYGLHNTAYWQQRKYVGFGAAAHSYDGSSRQWNAAHIKSYIDSLSQGNLNFEKEVLTEKDHFNEYIMTSLRTKWGMDLFWLQNRFPLYWQEIQPRLKEYLAREVMATGNGRLWLSERGWLISDDIFCELFVDNE